MSTIILAEAAEAAEHAAGLDLPFPAPVFGLIAFGALMGLLGITFAFRSVGTRH